MKRYLFLAFCSLIYFSGEAQQLQTQIQAKRGVFTDRLYLNGRWINRVSTDLSTADSADDNAIATSKAVADYVKLKSQSNSRGPHNFAQDGGKTVMNTTDETSILVPGHDPYIIPSSAWYVGKAYRVRMYLAYNTASSNSPTLEVSVKMGSNIVAHSGSFALGFNKSFAQLYCEFDIVCNSLGNMGGFISCGHRGK